jgi:tRNA(Ile)-lysidine synthase
MGNSRNSNSSSLSAAVAAALGPSIFPGAQLALGLSGGVDSRALLVILIDLAPTLRFSLQAVHVNHGISSNASRWAEFCADLCRASQVPLQLETVDIASYRRLGLEGAARRARYDVYARLEVDFLVLAHHRDDQAETLLLQLLRGAGVRGLAAMPAARQMPGTRARILRPLLGFRRIDIEAFARERGLKWVEDESNADTGRRRNFLRHEVLPMLDREFPAARVTVARAAAHLAEAGELLDQMARADLAESGDADGIGISYLLQLGEARAKNLLRYLCEERGMLALRTAQLDELLRQLREARADARVGLAAGGWEFLRHRGRLYIEPARKTVEMSFRDIWEGENALPLLDLGGALKFKPEEGRGLSVEKLRGAPVTVRLRQGGELLQPDCRRPRRTLKNLFQERGIPPWRRDRLPLLYCGENLVAVPGLGDACDFQAEPGEPGLIVTWEPFAQRQAR